MIFPRLPGTPARPSAGLRVFWVFGCSKSARFAPARSGLSFAIRVNAGLQSRQALSWIFRHLPKRELSPSPAAPGKALAAKQSLGFAGF
jgi:hypothetical protein